VQVKIGNAYYPCSCVRYVTPADSDSEDISVIIYISVGCGILLIIIIVAIIVGVMAACRRHRTPRDDSTPFSNSAPAYTEFDSQYDRQHSDISTAEAAASPSEYSEYCKPDPVEPNDNKEYKALGVPGSTDDASPYYFSPEKDFKC